MCGIAGIISSALEMTVDASLGEVMCDAIEHRGPDDFGIFSTSYGFIAMRRLSIIDLNTGRQPIHNEDKTVWVVQNGEIYNYKELKKELEGRGHRFYTRSDTECIVHCYEEYGEACFSKLRGMFGIAILDTRKRRLLLGRDPLGKKPLFYHMSDTQLMFGSEIKSLLATSLIDRELNSEAVRQYVSLGYIPTPESIFRAVAKIPPGSYLSYQDGRARIVKYWDIDFSEKRKASERELEAELEERLDEATRIRLVSDVPFGAFLSGGLDSSIVVALMARHLSTPVKTFSIGFKEAEFNELEDARRIASYVKSDHHVYIVEADAVSLLDDLIWHFDEPFADSSAIPTFLVSRVARNHVKMVLTGDGGDEAFAGYERYQKYRIVRALNALGGTTLGDLLTLLGKLTPALNGKRLTWLGERVRYDFPENYLTGIAITAPKLVQELLTHAAYTDDVYKPIRQHFAQPQIKDTMDKVLYGDINTYLLDDVLVKVDRMTMANSLEARCPLLDQELMAFSASLPSSLKIKGKHGKHLLRKVAARLLPAEALQKRKQGFAIPLKKWFQNDLREMTQDLLLSQTFKERGIFDPQIAERTMNLHVQNIHDYSEQLWAMLTFELWARRFLDCPQVKTHKATNLASAGQGAY